MVTSFYRSLYKLALLIAFSGSPLLSGFTLLLPGTPGVYLVVGLR